MIRPVKVSDAGDIVKIYNHYIANTTVSFEEETLSAEAMEKRIIDVTANHPWLVYEEEGHVVGYAYANVWRNRSAYRYSAETSVYLDVDFKRMGLGTKLYEALKGALKARGFHTAIACVTLPNDPSQMFHQSIGFKKIGVFQEVGYKFETWLNVEYWALKL
ncbi:MAG: hypothetical protein PWQ12_168 [Clostridiales bacterium]|jgi:phosphinothricin acetyltransferase|nr:hypothetical protein [Clostridiales bacterium]